MVRIPWYLWCAALAVTSGLLEKLDRQELEGVIGHEMAHVQDYDIRFMTIVAVLGLNALGDGLRSELPGIAEAADWTIVDLPGRVAARTVGAALVADVAARHRIAMTAAEEAVKALKR